MRRWALPWLKTGGLICIVMGCKKPTTIEVNHVLWIARNPNFRFPANLFRKSPKRSLIGECTDKQAASRRIFHQSSQRKMAHFADRVR